MPKTFFGKQTKARRKIKERTKEYLTDVGIPEKQEKDRKNSANDEVKARDAIGQVYDKGGVFRGKFIPKHRDS